MTTKTRRSRDARAWALAKSQHWVLAAGQLRDLGFTAEAVRHRTRDGRLHPVFRGVYAVGRPELEPLGRWKAATLTCGCDAALSHRSAAALWAIADEGARIETSSPRRAESRAGIVVHRARDLQDEVRVESGIPVTSPARTLIDIAPRLRGHRLEAAVNNAMVRGLVDPGQLHDALVAHPGRRGVGIVRGLVRRHSFVLTDSELERRFMPIALRAGLPVPRTREIVNGYRVDFYWPELGLVVETDGLRYHRSPGQQAIDRRRDQAHTAAGLTPLRFTHGQVRYQPPYVESILRRTARRLRGGPTSSAARE
jgi:very-short-patch-repair endonuclease